MNLLITGGAGYIGGLLINKILGDKKISKIFVIDLFKQPENIPKKEKLFWIKHNLAKNGWQEQLIKERVDVVVHSAFKIRCIFGKKRAIEKNNLEMCKNVFNFCFDNDIPKLIYLSSIAGYGARKENIGKVLNEENVLAEIKSSYGSQKREVEMILSGLISAKMPTTKMFVLRLASVTGPYGQALKHKFGLISVLKRTLPFIIETSEGWGRQWVHEHDVINVIRKLLQERGNYSQLEIFNIAPEDFLTAKDIGKLLNKKVVKMPAWLMRIGLFFLWPISFGKLIPPNSINGLIYPIKVDGAKIKKIGFKYRYSSKDSLLGIE